MVFSKGLLILWSLDFQGIYMRMSIAFFARAPHRQKDAPSWKVRYSLLFPTNSKRKKARKTPEQCNFVFGFVCLKGNFFSPARGCLPYLCSGPSLKPGEFSRPQPPDSFLPRVVRPLSSHPTLKLQEDQKLIWQIHFKTASFKTGLISRFISGLPALFLVWQTRNKSSQIVLPDLFQVWQPCFKSS